MPCISDPGVYLVQRCYEQGVPVESVPCCNAAIAAVAISGIDTARFAFEGFLPVDKKERRQRLAETAKLPHTLIYYEAPHKLRGTLDDLLAAFGDRKISAERAARLSAGNSRSCTRKSCAGPSAS